MPGQYTIGTLARQAGVNVETIRYYQRRGLVGEPDRPLGVCAATPKPTPGGCGLSSTPRRSASAWTR